MCQQRDPLNDYSLVFLLYQSVLQRIDWCPTSQGSRLICSVHAIFTHPDDCTRVVLRVAAHNDPDASSSHRGNYHLTAVYACPGERDGVRAAYPPEDR